MTRRQKVDSHYIGFLHHSNKTLFLESEILPNLHTAREELSVSFWSSIDVLKDWITSLISCEVSATEECFSQAKLRIFLTVPFENVCQAMSVPSKLPVQLDASTPDKCASFCQVCLLPSACCREP